MRLKLFNMKNKKYRIKKEGLSKRLIAIELISVLLLTGGCGIKKDTTTPAMNTIQYQAEEYQPHVSTSIIGEQSDYGKVYLDTYNYNDFKNFLSNKKIEFKYEETFNLEDYSYMEKEREEIHKSNYTRTIIKDGKIDKDALIESILRLSPTFKKESHHYMYIDVTDRNEISKILDLVIDSLEYEINKGTMSEEELNELDCKLNNLKLFENTGVTSASLTSELALLVNPNVIKMTEIASRNENSYRNIIYHETQHLIQMDCPHREQQAYLQAGLSRGYGLEELNPYNWVWSSEASAEKQVVNRTGDAPITYTYIVGYMDSMDLATIINPNSKGSTDIEDTSLHKDLKHFYELTTANGVISNEELTKLMFTFGIAQNQFDYRDYYNDYYNENISEDDYNNIRYDYKEKFCEGLVKMFYGNLSLSIKEKNIELNDIFYLIKLFEGDMNYHLEYSNSLTERNKEFLKFYNSIQEKFFSNLSLSMNISEEELYNRFVEYDMYYRIDGKTIRNSNLSWLGKNVIEYLEKKSNSETEMYTTTIYEIAKKQNSLTNN